MANIFNLINNVFTITIALYTGYTVFKEPLTVKSVHVLLTTTGYQLLMAQAIMSFAGDNLWTNFLDRNTKKNVHWVLGALGSLMAVIGSSLMFYVKSSHFTSIHGILGAIASMFIFTTFINGPLAYYSSRIKFLKPIQIKLGHYTMGTSGFIIGMISLNLGFQKKWFISRVSPEVGLAVAIISGLTVILTAKSALWRIYDAGKQLFARKKND